LDNDYDKSNDGHFVAIVLLGTSVSCAWDILFDFGVLGNDMNYLRKTNVSFLLILIINVVNTALRFGWLLRYFDGVLFNSHDEFVLVSEMIEVFRRCVWIVGRIEWEGSKL
jgi:hypothetical protein